MNYSEKGNIYQRMKTINRLREPLQLENIVTLDTVVMGCSGWQSVGGSGGGSKGRWFKMQPAG